MMRVFVKFVALESIYGPENPAVRKAFGEQLQKIITSGNMESGLSFADGRAGYMVFLVVGLD